MLHSDLNDLFDALLQMAQLLLTKQGEFLPIGAIMLADGQIRHVGAQIEGNDYPGSQPLIEFSGLDICCPWRSKYKLSLGLPATCPC